MNALSKWVSLAAVIGGLVVFGAGCSKSGGDSAGSTAQAGGAASAGATAEAGKIWTERCVACHGKGGEGNGPGSAALDPKPRNFKDKAWQDGVTDEHIEKVIAEGGPAVGQSALMPPNPDIAGKPEVLKALKDVVRAFGTK